MTDPAPLLTDAELAALRAPIETARTLPRRAFTSEEYFDRERRRIAERNWLAACFGDEIPDAGDARPIDLWGLPIVVVRDRSGVLRAFHNVCAYDGCPVLTENVQGAEALTAAYHGWSYSLDGELVDAPFWAGPPGNAADSVAPEHRRLVEIGIAEAVGIVFVDLFPDVAKPAFDDHVAPLLALLDQVAVDDLRLARGSDGEPDVFEASIRTNWKTFVENDCLNILHESFTHDLYRASPEVPRVTPDGSARFKAECDGNVMGFSYAETDVVATYPEIDLPDIGTSGPLTRGLFAQLYPNVSIAMIPTMIAPVLQFPERAGLTRVRGASLVHLDVAGPAHAAARATANDVFADAAAEDIVVVEGIQAVRASPARDTGFYSPFWDRPHYEFSKRVAADLEREHF
ncbi:MAG: aromatic ring-hydroxylating dioxygenase subunit alpha [Acidimicrobiales bacterium]|nr:aromatic ring-hydroxylating dioxygenase subunit alpha [Acidimicrobiales bacterium]